MAGDHVRGITVGLGVEDRMGVAAAHEEFLERSQPGITGRAHQNRPTEAERQQAEPPEGEGAEDAPTQVDLGDEQGPEALRRNEHHLHRAAGLDIQQGIGPRKLSDLGENVARPPALPDGDPSPEGIAAAEDHPPGEEHVHPRSGLPHLEQHGSIWIGAALPETGDAGNVGLVEWGENLVAPGFEVRELRTRRQFRELWNDVVGAGHG